MPGKYRLIIANKVEWEGYSLLHMCAAIQRGEHGWDHPDSRIVLPTGPGIQVRLEKELVKQKAWRPVDGIIWPPSLFTPRAGQSVLINGVIKRVSSVYTDGSAFIVNVAATGNVVVYRRDLPCGCWRSGGRHKRITVEPVEP